MKVKVYHASKEVAFKARCSDEGLVRSLSDKDFLLVAKVDVPEGVEGIDALSMAYEKTNNIDCNWSEHSCVEALVGGSVRSTSVGDVIEANGFKFVVAGIGFRLIY